MLDPALRDQLRVRLERSRGGLLAALEGMTERDFTGELGDAFPGGETVVQALAALASAERQATAAAAGETVSERAADRPLPPQVVHALAGARYRTQRYLESEQAEAAPAEALVAALVDRESAATARIAARPRLDPPPVFLMVQPRRP